MHMSWISFDVTKSGKQKGDGDIAVKKPLYEHL